MENKEEHYGLLTAVTMIIGIVIGSGIFFKSDDVLNYTGGSKALGVLVLCIGAFSIIFGSLTLTELSIRTKKNGGFVGYYEDFISKEAACGFGWFQMLIYYPALNAVVAWASGIYTCSLFNIKGTLENQVGVGLVFLTGIYLINILSLKLGGYFQNLSTVIKLIPLLGIAIFGMVSAPSHAAVPQGVTLVTSGSAGFRWLAALAPIAFSYDGWIIATSITNEVKKPEKNMPLALVIGPTVVLGVYLLYFLGITNMLGTDYIMSMGNNAVNKAGEILFGDNGNKVILIFVIISILGVVNGITLGSLRMPQALASKHMLPGGDKVAVINPRYQLSLKSCLISYLVTFFWMILHYFTQKSGIIGSSDVSEIAIVFSYICYIILYVKVIRMKKDHIIKSTFKGIICPIMGITGSAIILIGGIISNPVYVPIFMLICMAVGGMGFYYYHRKEKQA